jgi:hypothetical protein
LRDTTYAQSVDGLEEPQLRFAPVTLPLKRNDMDSWLAISVQPRLLFA